MEELLIMRCLVKDLHREAFVKVIEWATYIKTLSPGDPELSAALAESKKAREDLGVYTQELKRLNEELGSNP